MTGFGKWLNIVIFALVAVGSYFASIEITNRVESRTDRELRAALQENGFDWVTGTPDGLLVKLEGSAKDEAQRFDALEVVHQVAEGWRVQDFLKIKESVEEPVPDYRVEILRTDNDISLIGLLPANLPPEEMEEELYSVVPDARITNLSEIALGEAPESWSAMMGVGLTALRELKQSKISIEQNLLRVRGVAKSLADQERIEAMITRFASSEGFEIDIELSAPRNVASPFIFEAEITSGGSEILNCVAQTEEDLARLLQAAQKLPDLTTPDCEIALGMPAENWLEAAETGLAHLAELGRGHLTLSDFDMAMVGHKGTKPEEFAKQMRELTAELPQGYNLQTTPPPEENLTEETAPEFRAELNKERHVHLVGMVADETSKAAILNFASANFVHDHVTHELEIRENLPKNWPLQALAGIEALSKLHSGHFRMDMEGAALNGKTGEQQVQKQIAELLAARFTNGAVINNQVIFDPELPQEVIDVDKNDACEKTIGAILTEAQFLFAPGSAEISDESQSLVKEVAQILSECPLAAFEVSGHTDNTGSAAGNQRLSRQRAQAVIAALSAAGADMKFSFARGYGADNPIADNDTEEGRQRNRRIEFKLMEE